MIAYNRAWLDALLIKDTARQWHEQGILSGDSWQNIQEQHPAPFYSPNRFIRIGLAIFCMILLTAALGLAYLFGEPDSQTGVAMFNLFWGCVWIAALDFWAVQQARHYGSGIDDMLLYSGAGLIISSFGMLLPENAGPLAWSCMAWPFLLAGSIRYLDRPMAAATLMCSLLIVLLIVKDIPRVAPYLMPFAGMAFAAAIWIFARRGQRRYEWRYWYSALVVVELLALVLFYVSGNFWVVQEGAVSWFGMPQAPLAWFFWIFTFGVPVLYIWMGLRKKDRLLVDIGLGCVVAAVFTYRYYYHVLPLAWAAAIGGAVLLAGAYFAIRYLRKHPGAFTYDASPDTSLLQEAEEQLIEQTIASKTPEAPVKKDTMGGGQFGGGGASGEF